MGVSQARSDFGSEEDDDMVHVNRQGTCLSEYKKSSCHPCVSVTSYGLTDDKNEVQGY